MSLGKILIKNKILIIFTTFCLFFSFVFGLFTGHDLQKGLEDRVQTYNQTSAKLAKLTSLDVFTTVFFTNIESLLFLILGVATFGLTTLIGLIWIGSKIGLWASGIKQNVALIDLMVVITPHGIFEIPAIIIAGAAGFKIPYEIIRYLAGKKEQILTKEDIKEYLTLALISIVLIVIAAWVEANITLKIAKAMLNSTKSI
jgi:uncharacterized membrane protein SpoIIM required for sporulation